MHSDCTFFSPSFFFSPPFYSVEDTSPDAESKVRSHLRDFDLNKDPVAPLKEPPPFALPPLQGADILEHFNAIGLRQSQPYLSFAE